MEQNAVDINGEDFNLLYEPMDNQFCEHVQNNHYVNNNKRTQT